MLTREKVNEIFGVKESYKLPYRIMEMIFSDPESLYNAFGDEDKSVDFFRDYFQSEQGDRDALKQDFTPDSVGKIIAGMVDYEPKTIADVCAGTGSLTIDVWKKFPDAFFTCFEVSERTIPFLLLNLMVRNIRGEVVHKDILTEQVFQVYKLDKGLCFSNITKTNEQSNRKFDLVISNPPYSMKWAGLDHEDFSEYGIAPKSKADYAFILHSLAMLKDGGKLIEVVPHGVLFRGAKEGDIRKRLIENNLLDAVVGLPDKLFLNTGIPVCVMAFKKDSKNALIVDASKLCDKRPKQNVMTQEHIDKVVNAYKLRENVKKLSEVVTIDKIRENDFSLNVPRYVDTYEPEQIMSLDEAAKMYLETCSEIKKCEKEFLEKFEQLVATNQEKDDEFDIAKKYFRKAVNL